jgi:hypothetical protein
MTQLPLPLDGETVEIPLTRGYVAIVDAKDADLAELKWYAHFSGNSPYAQRRQPEGMRPKTILLHRVILGRMLGRKLVSAEIADHINRNTLDNRRSNLRLATPQQNQQNKGVQRNNTSGFKGVSRQKRSGKWKAEIKSGGKKIWLGEFDSPEEAYVAYCKAAKELHGEFFAG